MIPRILLMSVGSGKTYWSHKRPDVFLDSEDALDWDAMKSGYPSNIGRGFFEYEIDFVNLYMERILPLLLTAVASGRTPVVNLITPDNAMLVGHLLQGLHQRYGVGYVVVAPDTLAHHIMSRAGGRQYPFHFTHRGLMHAHANSLHLRGMADTYGLHMLRDIDLERYARQPDNAWSLPQMRWREGCAQHQLLEVLPGTWVESLDDNPSFIFATTRTTPQAVHLECRRGTKLCSNVHGGHCAVRLELTKDAVIGRWPGNDRGSRLSEELDPNASNANYATWIPRPATVSASGKRCVIGYTGSFAPFHTGHVEVLEIAKRHLEGVGYSVCAGYVSPWPFTGTPHKEAWHDFWASWQERARLTYLYLLEHPWLRFDGYLGLDGVCAPLDVKSLFRREHAMQTIKQRLLDVHGQSDIEVFWVNGDDAHYEASFFESQAFADSGIRICIVPRRTASSDHRWHDSTRWTICQEQPSLRISSTVIREAMLVGDTERARRYVGDEMAYAYLLYLYHKHVR